MIRWALREANPLYPVPVIWGAEDFRQLINALRPGQVSTREG